jgi:hypothetical protein
MTGLSTLKHLKFWILIPIAVVLEVFLQWRISEDVPLEADWKAAAAAVKEQKGPDDLVIVSPDWAVQGRMYLKGLISSADFGRFDTTCYRRIFEVSINGAKGPETKALSPEHTDRFGSLTVSRYQLPAPAEILYSFTDRWKDGVYKKTNKKKPRLMIDHWFHPRKALEVSLKHKASVTFKDVPLGGVLRGYTVIGYREGRFDKGDPIRLRVFLNDKKIGQKMTANFSPIEPFEYRLPGKGTGTVRFEVFAENNKKRQFGIAADVRKAGR